MDLVTVIVPIYKVEAYLRRCVDSILGQSYTNLEIILVDDGSPDKCGEICDFYSDPRIKVVHQKNKGLSGARNSGIDIMHGKWVTFVDSDDFIAKDYVEYLLNLCKKHKVLVSQCGNVRGCDNDFPEEVIKVTDNKWEFEELYCSPTRSYRTVAWGKMYHSSLFKELRFPEGKINEDEDTVFKALYEARDIVISNRHLYYYFMSSESILRSKKTSINMDFIEIFKDRIDYLSERNEVRMINITKKELCLRLMLNYFDAVKNKLSDDAKILRRVYKSYYRKLEFNEFATKEKYALKLFAFMPFFFAIIENKFSIIQKNKYRREKK